MQPRNQAVVVVTGAARAERNAEGTLLVAGTLSSRSTEYNLGKLFG
ncbi:MAG: hypothetical protein ACKV2U_33540 [Bryobacteraceae bacterium]